MSVERLPLERWSHSVDQSWRHASGTGVTRSQACALKVKVAAEMTGAALETYETYVKS